MFNFRSVTSSFSAISLPNFENVLSQANQFAKPYVKFASIHATQGMDWLLSKKWHVGSVAVGVLTAIAVYQFFKSSKPKSEVFKVETVQHNQNHQQQIQ